MPARALAWASALALAGCGGGLYIEVGGGFDDPPRVSLVASAASAVPGQTVRLAAAASDDRGIEQVAFYRLGDDGRATLLGADGAAPYEWDTAVPADARLQVRYFARAIDTAGQRRDSETVTITLP